MFTTLLTLVLALNAAPNTDAVQTPVELSASELSVETVAPLPGWATFGTRWEADACARRMRCRGFCARVFYDYSMGWWVCEWV
ncbi:MAG: hypothetical protein AAF726_21710 [Planctomycetota bacterium]